MRRHPALAPLSRDHHRALVEARAARAAASGDARARVEGGRRFAAFFAGHAVPHFRSEEEDIFPLLSRDGGEPPESLTRALLDHVRLHALAGEIRAGVESGDVDGAALEAAGALLAEHVRLEERVLFPLIEERAGEEGLAALRLHDAEPERPGAQVVADLRTIAGRGVAWSAATPDLNVNLVVWPAGGGVGSHVNTERDVLLAVLDGSGTVEVDGEAHALTTGAAAIVPAGAERAVRAGPEGIRYLSVHLRRPPGITLG
ncbi:MAG: hemerythrin domain-containing protein [Solirubrobacterales bacterium]